MDKKPVRIFSDDPELKCEYCGTDLLNDGNHGNYIVFKSSNDDGKFASIKYACKEHNSKVTEIAKLQNLIDCGWDDVDDLLIPTIWIKKLMAFMNELYESRESINEEYFDNVKNLFLNTFPYVTREMSKEELNRISKLLAFDF